MVGALEVLKLVHVGKSVWLYYAAHHCAAEMKPFIWFHDASYYLFVKEGVYWLLNGWEHNDFQVGCTTWTLVDADKNKDGVPPHLIPHGTVLFVIFVTSPTRDRWSRMNKTTQRTVVIMNPWARREIHRL